MFGFVWAKKNSLFYLCVYLIAFMDELGFSDNEDLTEGSAPIYSPGEPGNQNNDADEESSDWDTTPRSQSDQMATIKLADNYQTEVKAIFFFLPLFFNFFKWLLNIYLHELPSLFWWW